MSGRETDAEVIAVTEVQRYYKATRPDGSDFRTGTVSYADALASGSVLEHPNGSIGGEDASGYFSVATVATDCTGMSWPCRLFEVEPVGDVWTPDAGGLPNKRACLAVRVVREVDAPLTLGPQGEHIVALIERCRSLTARQVDLLDAAWDAAGDTVRSAAEDTARDTVRYTAWYTAGYTAGDTVRYTAWYTAEDAARDTAWDAAWYTAGYAARDVAWALVVRDLIGQHGFTQEHYDTLTGPWRTAIGPIHPDDEDIREVTK